MVAIRAHFDGKVFVPDEPVGLLPGDRVVVQQVARTPDAPGSDHDTSFVRKLDIHLDEQSLREIMEDPELGMENL